MRLRRQDHEVRIMNATRPPTDHATVERDSVRTTPGTEERTGDPDAEAREGAIA